MFHVFGPWIDQMFQRAGFMKHVSLQLILLYCLVYHFSQHHHHTIQHNSVYRQIRRANSIKSEHDTKWGREQKNCFELTTTGIVQFVCNWRNFGNLQINENRGTNRKKNEDGNNRFARSGKRSFILDATLINFAKKMSVCVCMCVCVCVCNNNWPRTTKQRKNAKMSPFFATCFLAQPTTVY